MQHQIEYDSRSKILIGTTYGTATVVGLCEYLDELAGHPNLSDCVGIVSDHRKLNMAELGYADVSAVADRATEHANKWRGLKHPIVVNRHLDLGIVRLYETVGGGSFGYRTQICHTLDEATAAIVASQSG
jgi:hypothetical protein